jgi:hypothetical protein
MKSRIPMSGTEIWAGGRKRPWMPEENILKTNTSREFGAGK